MRSGGPLINYCCKGDKMFLVLGLFSAFLCGGCESTSFSHSMKAHRYFTCRVRTGLNDFPHCVFSCLYTQRSLEGIRLVRWFIVHFISELATVNARFRKPNLENGQRFPIYNEWCSRTKFFAFNPIPFPKPLPHSCYLLVPVLSVEWPPIRLWWLQCIYGLERSVGEKGLERWVEAYFTCWKSSTIIGF